MENRRFRMSFVVGLNECAIGIEGYRPQVQKNLFYEAGIYVPEKLSETEILKKAVEVIRESYPDCFIRIKGPHKIIYENMLNVRYLHREEYIYRGVEGLAKHALDSKLTTIRKYD